MYWLLTNDATLRSVSVSVQTGKLPFITHLAHPVPPAHLSSLPSFSDPDEELEDGEKLDAACWKAYIEGNAVDIVVRHFIICTSGFASLRDGENAHPCLFLSLYISTEPHILLPPAQLPLHRRQIPIHWSPLSYEPVYPPEDQEYHQESFGVCWPLGLGWIERR